LKLSGGATEGEIVFLDGLIYRKIALRKRSRGERMATDE
jgi:hypothetical protein